jgi:hypothetical protein
MTIKNSLVVLSAIRIVVGLVIGAAIVTQLMHTVEQQRGIANFFSFFTIQSNCIAAVILLIAGIGGLYSRRATVLFASLRGAATLYMTLTGVVFVLLLSGLGPELQLTLPWVNIVLHYIAPALVLLDWLIFPPKLALRKNHAFIWLAFPMAYLTYSLIRGYFTDWYPYPFLNPQNGWLAVAATCICIAIGTAIVSTVIAKRSQA